MKITDMIKLQEFIPYFFIGGTATAIDWSIFWIAITQIKLHYLPALIIAFTTAGLFHYFSNKFFTFKCNSKKISSQYTLYLFIALSSLLLSMGVMALLVKLFLIETMTARILTTALTLIPNYLLHKHITFSKKLFVQTEL